MFLETLLFNESPEKVELFTNALRGEKRAVERLSPALPKKLVAGKAAKRLFAKYADRKFLDSLVTIHWTRDLVQILTLADNLSARNDEISCNATIGTVPSSGEFGNHGLLVKGYITFLANDMDHVYSGTYHDYVPGKNKTQPPLVASDKISYDEFDPFAPKAKLNRKEIETTRDWYTNFMNQRKKTSGINKGINAYSTIPSVVLDKEDFLQKSENEALVDHWKPLAIITDISTLRFNLPNAPDLFMGTSEEVYRHLKKQGLI